jgi:ubiquinone/menaquinone biosynthesis C-methylase UbiE
MSKIEKFYDAKVVYEWERLERHRTEFAVTMQALRDYLPRPSAKILDIGGGPGRYAIALAKQGYNVTLLDISKRCLEFARNKAKETKVRLSEFIHGNATNLKMFSAESYDAVLLMGPMYHLLSLSEREKALQEARRVLKKEGLIFASFIMRYAVIRWAAKNEPSWILEHQQRVRKLLVTGILEEHKENTFTDAYFADPLEIKPLMKSNGFKTMDLIACEGVISMIEDKVNELKGDLWDAWVELNYKLGKDPTVHGAAEHLLHVGRKM